MNRYTGDSQGAATLVQTLTIMSQSVRFVCASATGRAGNDKERNKQDVKKNKMATNPHSAKAC